MFQIARAGRGRRFSFRPGLACPGGLVAYPRGAPTRNMGTIARIYQAAMRGRYYDDIQSNVLLRRILGLLLLMEA